MANNLSVEKKALAISMLAEGSSIRAIERVTGVHRDTIMRLGVRVGEGCARLHDQKMRGLACRNIQVDELWGFIGKKRKHVGADDRDLGDVWTYIGLDRESKLIPAFLVGKREGYYANQFMTDLASRLTMRVQLSSDALAAYPDAVKAGFGDAVDYAQVVKTYTVSHLGSFKEAATRYSPAEVCSVELKPMVGQPDYSQISTSHVEKQNHTVRMHVRRLTRLTNAFSKKLENFKAAMALHFAYYNFCKRHIAIRMTPAQAAGIESSALTVPDLLEICGE